MNKRMKKKRVLFEHIKTVGFVLDQALVVIKDQAKEIAELRELVERNAQATNSEITAITLDTTKLDERLSYLESENKSMRVDLKFKKPFWKR
ncbi:hypothetical protein PFZ59_11005 [Streptococcus suis]|uniref:hypothetical protein n=1 Tax=Streptococcus suis TaxID=1307 RepID=UPI00240E3780|nr:hypothetical protein [Streptococcus suis]WFA75663.1 hypothetical protein PFZ59_11005 [Streptococcus suis]